MKKSLLLLALLGAAAAAHAQSSLTFAGTVDTAVTRVNGSKTSATLLTSGGNSTSKLIFRGVEDLGGGTNASFWLESGFLADSGLFQTATVNSGGTAGDGGLIFGRRSIVAIGNARFGDLQLGRNWTPTYDAFTSRYDVFGVGVGIGLNYTASINPKFIRMSNDIAYVTPRFFGGLHANIQHWFGESAPGTPKEKDGTGDGIRVTYEAGPISVLASFGHTHFAAGDAYQRNAAAYYDFGFLKVTGNFNHDQQGSLKQEGFLVGAIVPVGAFEWKGSYSQLKTLSGDEPTGRKFALGGVYNLSKRTALYATVARVENRNGAILSIAGATTEANRNASGMDIGLRHNF